MASSSVVTGPRKKSAAAKGKTKKSKKSAQTDSRGKGADAGKQASPPAAGPIADAAADPAATPPVLPKTTAGQSAAEDLPAEHPTTEEPAPEPPTAPATEPSREQEAETTLESEVVPAPHPELDPELEPDWSAHIPVDEPRAFDRRTLTPKTETTAGTGKFASRAERNGHDRKHRGSRPARHPAQMRRTGRVVIRFVSFLLLTVIVLSLGTALTDQRTDRGNELNATEIARGQALADIRTLRAEIAAFAPGPDAAQLQLTVTTEMLALQAELLAAPRPSAGPAGSPSVAESGASIGTPTAVPATPTASSIIGSLAETAAHNLATAEQVQPGMARLLASVGAAQLVQSVALAESAGLEPPAVPSLGTGAELTGAACSAGTARQPAGTDAEAEADPDADSESDEFSAADGIRAAVSALHRVVYSYEVLTTQLPEPAFSTASDRLGDHQSARDTAVDLAAARCIDVPLADAGYALPARPAHTPQEYLAEVESELAAVCADLIALSVHEVRTWAIGCLTEAAVAEYGWTGSAQAVPGLAAAVPPSSTPSEPAPQASASTVEP